MIVPASEGFGFGMSLARPRPGFHPRPPAPDHQKQQCRIKQENPFRLAQETPWSPQLLRMESFSPGGAGSAVMELLFHAWVVVAIRLRVR